MQDLQSQKAVMEDSDDRDDIDEPLPIQQRARNCKSQTSAMPFPTLPWTFILFLDNAFLLDDDRIVA